MKYYKANREAHDHFTGWTIIKDELVTPREKETKFRYLDDSIFTEVNIKSNRTFKIFGIRFERISKETY